MLLCDAYLERPSDWAPVEGDASAHCLGAMVAIAIGEASCSRLSSCGYPLVVHIRDTPETNCCTSIGRAQAKAWKETKLTGEPNYVGEIKDCQ